MKSLKEHAFLFIETNLKNENYISGKGITCTHIYGLDNVGRTYDLNEAKQHFRNILYNFGYTKEESVTFVEEYFRLKGAVSYNEQL